MVLDLSQASPHNRIIHLYQIVYDVPLIKHTNLCLCVCDLQNAKYVWEKSEFDSVNPSHTDFLMGKKNLFFSVKTDDLKLKCHESEVFGLSDAVIFDSV